jgi:hypothetical protein
LRDDLTDRDGVPRGDQDLEHFASHWTGECNGRFVGFEFHQALIGLDGIPFLDQQLQHIARIDSFAEPREFNFNCHI